MHRTDFTGPGVGDRLAAKMAAPDRLQEPVHLVDRDCPLLFTNGKGGSQLAARASALGEFFERLSCHYLQ